MDVSETLREARIAAGLTQADLARLAGTSQATVSQYERGRKDPTVATFSRLVEATGAAVAVGPLPRRVLRPTAAELDRVARTLADVLELSAMLPTRHEAELRFPRLPVSVPPRVAAAGRT